MILRELFARMGIVVDEDSVKKADHTIAKFAEHAKHALEAYGVFKLYEFVQQKFEHIAETAANLEHLAQKTGLTTQALQELGYAAQQSGLDAGELQMGLVHLARSADEAHRMGGAAGAAFYRLGIQVAGADGRLKGSGQILAEVADRFARMPDGPEKAALAMEIFSRAGANMIPLLNRGSAGLQKFGIEARKTGAVMSETLIKQGVELHKGMLRLHAVFEGLTYAVLAPFVKRMTEGRNSLANWIVANEKIISLRVQETVGLIGQAFSFAAEMVKKFTTASIIAAGVLLTAFSPVLAIFTALFLILEDIYSFTQGRDSYTKDLLDFFFGDAPKAAKSGQAAGAPGQGTGIPTFDQGMHNLLWNLFGTPPGPQPVTNQGGFSPNITINAPGNDPKDIAGAVREQLEDFWWTRLRESMPF